MSAERGGGFSGARDGKVNLIPLVANRFLTVMSLLAVSYLLLDAGVKAEAALAKLPQGHADRAFYEGKRHSGLWFARNVLPQAKNHAEIALLEDESPSTCDWSPGLPLQPVKGTPASTSASPRPRSIPPAGSRRAPGQRR